jgi:anti-sigma B factor antagonist
VAPAREIVYQLLLLRSEREGATHVIEAYGELDMSTRAALEGELESVGATDAEQVLLDLRGLDFIDCSGLGVILQMHERARRRRLRFVVAPGPPQVHRVFALTSAASTLRFVT